MTRTASATPTAARRADARRRDRRGGAVALVALGLAPLLILAFSRVLIIDDAFITYRYAAQFAAGHGLVFNPGERVEGSTSLLWTLLTALPIALGWPIEWWAPGIGLALGLLALRDAWLICRALRLRSGATLVALAALGLAPGFWLVMTNGMEGGLVASLVARTLLLTVTGRLGWAGVCGGLLFAARPDAAGVLPLCALYVLARSLHGRAGTLRARVGPALVMLAPWAAIVGAVTLWRLAYYGAWVPNTITAKSPPALTTDLLRANVGEGLRYWGGFFGEAAPFVVGAALAVLLAPRRAIIWLCLGIVALQLPVILINGGDWIPRYRLLMVYVPALAIPLAVALDRLGTLARGFAGRGQIVALGGVGLLLAVAVASSLGANRWEGSPAVRINPQGVVCTDYRALAAAVGPALAPDDRIAPEALGIFSYLLRDTYAHDFLGLTDRHLARYGTTYWAQIGKSDFAYTYRVAKPTFFVFHSGPGFANDLYFTAGGAGGQFDGNYGAYTLRGLKACSGNRTIVVLSRASIGRILPALAPFDPQPLTLGFP